MVVFFVFFQQNPNKNKNLTEPFKLQHFASLTKRLISLLKNPMDKGFLKGNKKGYCRDMLEYHNERLLVFQQPLLHSHFYKQIMRPAKWSNNKFLHINRCL